MKVEIAKQIILNNYKGETFRLLLSLKARMNLNFRDYLWYRDFDV